MPDARPCAECGTLFVPPDRAPRSPGQHRFCSRACGRAGGRRVDFWSLVAKSDGCWLWSGSVNRGRGRVMVRGVRWSAPRYAWTLVNGPIPDGMNVCHDCPTGDNPLCVNPAHLFLGTQPENVADMIRKGRRSPLARPRQQARGEANASKLTSAQVVEIRARRAAGETLASLAAAFRVGKTTIHGIASGQKWRHLPLTPQARA